MVRRHSAGPQLRHLAGNRGCVRLNLCPRPHFADHHEPVIGERLDRPVVLVLTIPALRVGALKLDDQAVHMEEVARIRIDRGRRIREDLPSLSGRHRRAR